MLLELLLVFHAALVIKCEDTLLLTQVVWRHGDRAPTKTYPTDVHFEDAWPNGWGELTQLGMQQHYQLGKLLRNRYIDERPGFLEPRYKSKQVYIQSTDYNRTLISAMSNLAGMFPTGVPGTEYPDSSEWPSNWTPIPVHTVKFDTDFVGNMWAVCPRKTELDKFIQSSAEYQRVVNENKEFFKFLSNKTGMPVTMYDMYTLYDVHFIETKYNLSQPEWFTEKVAKKIWNLTHIKNEFNYGISKPYVPELIKLRGGPLLKEMVERMLEKVECLEHPSARCKWIQNLKYHAYSAHDTTIAGFLSTLGDEEKVIGGISLPQYTAAIAVELWNVTSVGPSVKILYHPGYNHHFHTITGLTKGCPQRQEFCKLDTFHRRSKIFMPGNMEEDCKPKAGQYHSDEGMNSTKRKLRMRHT